MRIKLLFMGLCLCLMANMSYGQSQTQSLKQTAPAVVSSNPDLSAQRTKLDTKQAEINQVVSTSRAQVSKLNDELRVLKQEYIRLLNTELEKVSDAEVKTQLQEEIIHYSEAANPQTH